MRIVKEQNIVTENKKRGVITLISFVLLKKGWKEKRVSEDEMAGWHHQCNGHELGETSGDSEGQGGTWTVCCSPWGHKELDMTG